jgi:prevent-host-death family protein
MATTTIGIRELKARLSHYLDQVRKGARLTVTDRGRAVAVITPIEESESVRRMHEMVAAGLASWNGGKPTPPTRRIKLKGGRLASDAVLEDRR